MTIPYLGPAHFVGGPGNKPIHRIVIHGTVSPTVKGGARAVAAYFRSKAAGGSAHFVVDPWETVRVVHDNTVAFHAPPNQHSLGVELCDPQTGSAGRWHNQDHQAMLRRAATLVASLCATYGVPIVKLDAADLKAGRHGICGHLNVSNAFGQTSHTDPGPDFPWPQFLGMVVAATHAGAAPKGKPLTLWMRAPRGPAHRGWIKVAQRHLGIPVTGVFDSSMRRVVVAFRRRHRLHPYRPGVIGPKAWADLLKKGPRP